MPRPFINLLPGGFRHPGEVACVYHNSEDMLHSRVMCREDKFQGQMNEALVRPPLCTGHCLFRRLLLAVADMFCPAVVRSDLLCDDVG